MQRYLGEEVGGLLQRSPQGGQHWRQALEGAFQMQLGRLESVYPAVTLQGLPEDPVLLSSTPLPRQQSAAELETASLSNVEGEAPLPFDAEERQKRRPLPVSSTPSPQSKFQRTQWDGPVGRRMGFEHVVQAELFADLSLEEESDGEGHTEALCREAKEHSEWIKQQLAGSVSGSPPAKGLKRGELSVQEELIACSRFTTLLHELKRGF